MLSRLTAFSALLAFAVLLPMPLHAQGKEKMAMKAPPSRTASVTGTVVDVSCKFGQGLTGAEHRMCAQVCSDRGIPLAILTDEGELYLPTSADMPGEAQNHRLKEFAEQRVTVSGKIFEASGAKAIQIASVKKA